MSQQQAAHAQPQARSATKARATFDTGNECAAWEPDGSIPQFSLLCLFRCLSLHKSSLKSISALSMRTRGTESYSSPKHMGNECPLPFASVRRPAPFSTEIASLMRLAWLDLTRQMDPTHFSVGDTVPVRQPSLLSGPALTRQQWWGDSRLRKTCNSCWRPIVRAPAISREPTASAQKRVRSMGSISWTAYSARLPTSLWLLIAPWSAPGYLPR